MLIIALMMGELSYMPALNPISSAIVARAVEIYRATPGSVLVCESAPMAAAAVRLGLDPSEVITALPQPRDHTTRLVARWLASSPYAGRRTLLVTHTLHAPRSRQIFARAGIAATTVPLDLPFDPADPDWKLRSARIFRLYDCAAWFYCLARGWV